MKILRRKKPVESDLRFCRHASELDASQLFGEWDLTLAISKVTEWNHDASVNSDESFAFGIVDDMRGFGAPLLPVQVHFVFRPPYTEGKLGHGEVFKVHENSTEAHYETKITIFDPQRKIYDRFLSSIEHAALSRQRFVHLVLRRVKKPYITDNAERDRAQKQEDARLKELMAIAETDYRKMPSVDFVSVAFKDAVTLPAPAWSYSWFDANMHDDQYRANATRQWRQRPWNKPSS